MDTTPAPDETKKSPFVNTQLVPAKKKKNLEDIDEKEDRKNITQLSDNFLLLKVTDYEIISTSAIDEKAIRRIVLNKLGPKAGDMVLLFNAYGFSGKANATLIWRHKDDKGDWVEENVYKIGGDIFVSGRTDMKPTDITPARLVRVFSSISAIYWADVKTTVYPFGLITNDKDTKAYNWWFGGIYATADSFDQMFHFLGMAFYMKNKKPVPKALALDFPCGYARRAIATPQLLAVLCRLMRYIKIDDSLPSSFDKAIGDMKLARAMNSEMCMEEIKKVTDISMISYIMTLGSNYLGMLTPEQRNKFTESIISDATRKSSFVAPLIEEAKKSKS